MANKVQEMLESAVSNIKSTFEADSIIGTPITADDGTIIVPVNRVSYGFGGGGGDFTAKDGKSEGTFAGGIGGGATVRAEAFLVINGENVRLITMNGGSSPADRIIDMIPGVISKANKFMENRKNKSGKNGEAVNDNNEG